MSLSTSNNNSLYLVGAATFTAVAVGYTLLFTKKKNGVNNMNE